MKEKPNHIKPILCVMAVVLTVVFFNIASQAIAKAAPPVVDAGGNHTVGLKSDGTVVAVGDNVRGQCDVSSWTDIVHVAAGGDHTVGVKSDGTVLAVGYNGFDQCNVSSWTDIIKVAAGGNHTVGLKSNGTVVAVGYNIYGQCDVISWADIEQLAAGGGNHTLGLTHNDRVAAAGQNTYGQCDVYSWTDIVQVAAGTRHTVGVKSDGTVLAVGHNSYDKLNVSSWTDIVHVAAGGDHTVGVKSDGKVVAVGYDYYDQLNVSSWTDIVQVAAGNRHTVGVKSDGTVVAVGRNNDGQCNVAGWNLLDDDYPHRDYDCPNCNDPGQNCQPCGADDWGFCILHCTSFVAWRMNRDAGEDSFTNSMNGGHWGNAQNWDDNAVQLGLLINQTPKVGAIAHWNDYDLGGDWGHVAYVEQVNEDGTVIISEYNFGPENRCAYGVRHLQSSDIPRYIHYTYLDSAYLDSDGDGVINQWDACHDTPPSSYVNQQGCPRRLKGDFDDDCNVDGSDLAIFASEFGKTECPPYE